MGLPMLVTSRLQLRPWDVHDIDSLHSLFNDQNVRKYLWDDVVIPRERVVELVESHFATVASHDIGYWAIHAGPMLGFCGFRFLENSSEIELLYGLLPEYWGKGLATEASQAALHYLWQATPFQRVWARTDAPNLKSVGVMRRLGMRHESSTETIVSYVFERP
jgi:ribosomal-protein-alanine N-acetyltransferase